MTSLLKLTRPLLLFLAALTYFFGTSLADYLGRPIRLDSFWLGLVLILLLQVTMNLLPEVYRPQNEPLLENETRADKLTLRNNVLYISMAALASIAAIAYILYNTRHLPAATLFYLVFSLVVILLCSTPPFRLINRGFGEILLAVQLAYIFPSMAFTLQNGTTHRFLVLAIPLTFLAFCYLIVMDFQSFAQDQKYNRVTFLTRLGWERVIPLHHIFILFAYIFFMVMPALGLSLTFLWPAFLTFPFALFQINQLRNVSLGIPPNWTLLTATSLAVFGLTTYFLALTFWLR
jgi:1,4-dihydroxy-2-naphthoate octaprenyltransferase